MTTKLERDFQKNLTEKLERMFPGSIILKGNSAVRQGVPDWIILHEDTWAALEVKRSASATRQPNQDFYVESMGNMAYAAFIYPENEEEILNELQSALRTRRKARVSKRI